MWPAEQRENVRVNDRLQVSYRILKSGEDTSTGGAEKFFPYVWTKYPYSLTLNEEVEDGNFKILPHIVDLNRKIDLLIELLCGENKPQVEVPEMMDVSISASGIKISIGEPSASGQRIALCIILPSVPPTKMFIMGEITRSVLLPGIPPGVPPRVPPGVPKEESGLYDTGVKFLDLNAEDQEKIIKYIFKRQRDTLRDKKLLTKAESID